MMNHRPILLLLLSIAIISCGKNDREQSVNVSNIANGDRLEADHKLNKKIVSILTPYKEFKCTGSILTKNSILTAAHCITSYQSVIVNGNTYSVEKNILHPKYSYYNLTDDIAIIKLKTEIDPHDFHPVTLDTSDVLHEKLKLVGRSIYITSPYPDYFTALLKVLPEQDKRMLSTEFNDYIQNLPIIKSDLKNIEVESFTLETYRSLSLNKKNSEVLFYNNFPGGPLPGDSGSPLFVENKDGSFFQKGITQYVKMNYESMYYTEYHVHDSTAYANVSYYLSWIEEMTQKHGLGEMKKSEAEEKQINKCDELKLNINELFIEKFGFQFLDNVIKEQCEKKDQFDLNKVHDNIKQCQKHCGAQDKTCLFAEKSITTLKNTLKKLCYP